MQGWRVKISIIKNSQAQLKNHFERISQVLEVEKKRLDA